MLYNNSAGGGAAGSGASGGGGGLYTLYVQCPLAESIWDGGGKQSHLSHSLTLSLSQLVGRRRQHFLTL